MRFSTGSILTVLYDVLSDCFSKPVICIKQQKNYNQGKTGKKYVKQVTGRYNQTDLHLAAKKGAVKKLLDGLHSKRVYRTLRLIFERRRFDHVC